MSCSSSATIFSVPPHISLTDTLTDQGVQNGRPSFVEQWFAHFVRICAVDAAVAGTAALIADDAAGRVLGLYLTHLPGHNLSTCSHTHSHSYTLKNALQKFDISEPPSFLHARVVMNSGYTWRLIGGNAANFTQVESPSRTEAGTSATLN